MLIAALFVIPTTNLAYADNSATTTLSDSEKYSVIRDRIDALEMKLMDLRERIEQLASSPDKPSKKVAMARLQKEADDITFQLIKLKRSLPTNYRS